MSRKVLYAQHQTLKNNYLKIELRHACVSLLLNLLLVSLMIASIIYGERWEVALFSILLLLSGLCRNHASNSYKTVKELIDLWDNVLAVDQEIDDLIRGYDADDFDSDQFPKTS